MSHRPVLIFAVFVGLTAVVAPLLRASRWFKAVELTLAVVRQPREEVVVTGYLKNHRRPAFSLETLLIEEPGKKPYKRQVSLDAERRFELALGQPIAGAYRVAALTRKAAWSGGVEEQWLKTPELRVTTGPGAAPQKVTSQDFDYKYLLWSAVVSGIGAAAIALVVFRPQRRTLLPAANQDEVGGAHST